MSSTIQFMINESPSSMIQLAEQIATQRYTSVYICTNNATHSEVISDILWTYPKDRFIPNSTQLDAIDSVILIHENDPPSSRQFIINLSNRLLPRVNIEWVTQQLPLARQRYQHWKKLGHHISTYHHKEI